MLVILSKFASKSLIAEKRLIFSEAGDKVKESLATVLDVVKDLLEFTSDTLKWGVDSLKLGVVYTKEGIKRLYKEITDPGQPDLSLDVYNEKMLLPTFTPESVGDPDLDYALDMHSHLLFLNYKTKQYTEFMKPALDEFQSVSAIMEVIRANNWTLSGTIDDYRDKIGGIEKTLASGHVPAGSTLEVRLRSELAKLKSEKAYFEKLCSFEVDWNKPEFQIVEFPPGSGEKKQRFVPNKSTKVKIDIRDLAKWLQAHTAGYKAELQKFSFKDEKKRLAYERDEYADRVATKIEVLEKQKKEEENVEKKMALLTELGNLRIKYVSYELKIREMERKVLAFEKTNIVYRSSGTTTPIGIGGAGGAGASSFKGSTRMETVRKGLHE